MALLTMFPAQSNIGLVLAVVILRHHERLPAPWTPKVFHLPHRPVGGDHIIREVRHRDIGVGREVQGSGIRVLVRDADRASVVGDHCGVPLVRDPVALEPALCLYIVDVSAGAQAVVGGAFDGRECFGRHGIQKVFLYLV